MKILICPKCKKHSFVRNISNRYECSNCNHTCGCHPKMSPYISKFNLENKIVNCFGDSLGKKTIMVTNDVNTSQYFHVDHTFSVIDILTSIPNEPKESKFINCWLDEMLELGFKLKIIDPENNFYVYPKVELIKPNGKIFWIIDLNKTSIENLTKPGSGAKILDFYKSLIDSTRSK